MVAASERAIGGIEKADAARTAKELTSGAGEVITLEPSDVDRDLPCRLTRVDDERYVELFANGAYARDILHEP